MDALADELEAIANVALRHGYDPSSAEYVSLPDWIAARLSRLDAYEADARALVERHSDAGNDGAGVQHAR